jgi:hypothetical protein
MDDKYNYVPESDPTDEDMKKLELLIDEKIHLPVDTYDLMNHYHFDSREDYSKFIEDYSLELFGAASAFPRAFDTINRLQYFGEVNDLFDVILISTEKDKAIAATYHFLAKGGCKIKNVKFLKEYYDKWEYCDVVVDDCPAVFENKPENKISVRINHPYNVYSEVDYSFNSTHDLYNEMFLLKIFSPEKYEKQIEREKEKMRLPREEYKSPEVE